MMVYCSALNLIQVDRCQEEMSSIEKFTELRDKKVAAAPASVVRAFFDITRPCTHRNFKKRCLIDQVIMLLYNVYLSPIIIMAHRAFY